MTGWWRRFNLWLEHPGVRIDDGGEEPDIATLLSVAALLEDYSRPAPAGPGVQAPPPTPAVEEPAPAGPPKALVNDLCNRLHQLSRTVRKAKEQGSSEGDRLKGHMDRLDKILGEYSITWEDLAGQAYDPGRSDFESLGEPQETAGLTRKTILQCERPVVKLSGRVIQTAKGIVGKPAEVPRGLT